MIFIIQQNFINFVLRKTKNFSGKGVKFYLFSEKNFIKK
jgi:hypothetical protein